MPTSSKKNTVSSLAGLKPLAPDPRNRVIVTKKSPIYSSLRLVEQYLVSVKDLLIEKTSPPNEPNWSQIKGFFATADLGLQITLKHSVWNFKNLIVHYSGFCNRDIVVNDISIEKYKKLAPHPTDSVAQWEAEYLWKQDIETISGVLVASYLASKITAHSEDISLWMQDTLHTSGHTAFTQLYSIFLMHFVDNNYTDNDTYLPNVDNIIIETKQKLYYSNFLLGLHKYANNFLPREIALNLNKEFFETLAEDFKKSKRVSPIFSIKATPSEIGERIRAARKERGWTQRQLAEAMGYRTPRAVENIENAYQNTSVQAVRAAMEALDLDEL